MEKQMVGRKEGWKKERMEERMNVLEHQCVQ